MKEKDPITQLKKIALENNLVTAEELKVSMISRTYNLQSNLILITYQRDLQLDLNSFQHSHNHKQHKTLIKHCSPHAMSMMHTHKTILQYSSCSISFLVEERLLTRF